MKFKNNYKVLKPQPKLLNSNQVFTANKNLHNIKKCQIKSQMNQNSMYYRQPIKMMLATQQKQLDSFKHSSEIDKENDLQNKIQIYKQKLNNNRNQIVQLRSLQSQILNQNQIIRKKLQQINLIIQQDNKKVFILDKQLTDIRRTYKKSKIDLSQKHLHQIRSRNKELKLKAQEYLLNQKLVQVKRKYEEQKPPLSNFSKLMSQKSKQNISCHSNNSKQEQVTKQQIQQLLQSQYLKQILKNKVYVDKLKNQIKVMVKPNMKIDPQLKQLIYS